MTYSAHDDQTINMIEWIKPSNFDLSYAQFASNIYFELWYNPSCIAISGDPACFEIQVRYNGVQLAFN